MKQSATVMVWGDTTGPELTKLHILYTRQTLTSEYYINQILEKEVEPLTSRRQVKGGPIEWKLFSSNTQMTFVRMEHCLTLQRSVRWKNNLLNFIAKDGWPANSRHIDSIENICSIIAGQCTKIHPLKQWITWKGKMEKCNSWHAKGTCTFYA